MTGVFIRGRREDLTDTEEKAEIGGQLAAKGPGGLPAPPEARREIWDGFSLEHQEEPTPQHLKLGLLDPEL